MSQTYISFDVATKSLAVAICTFDFTPHSVHYYADCSAKELIQVAKKFNNDTNKDVKFHKIEVVDLIPGKKTKDTTEVERGFKLNRYLQTLMPEIQKHQNPLFLIEYQMGPNNMSRFISAQLIMFCATFCKDYDQIRLIGPALKNKFYFPSDPQSRIQYYLNKYASNYTANKNHTKYCFLKLLQVYDQMDLIENIAKKNIDDAADAALMALSFHIFKRNRN